MTNETIINGKSTQQTIMKKGCSYGQEGMA